VQQILILVGQISLHFSSDAQSGELGRSLEMQSNVDYPTRKESGFPGRQINSNVPMKFPEGCNLEADFAID
jgi:hypothetical protein